LQTRRDLIFILYHLQGEKCGGEELQPAVETPANVLEGGCELHFVVHWNQDVAGQGDGGETGDSEEPKLRPEEVNLRWLTHQRDRRQETIQKVGQRQTH